MNRNLNLITTIAITLATTMIVAASSLPVNDSAKTITAPASATLPDYQARSHDRGRIHLPVSNAGTFTGRGFFYCPGTSCDAGNGIGPCEYPKVSGATYAYSGALWVGAIVNGDTLVSVGHDGWQLQRELNPLPGTSITFKSTESTDSLEREGAISPEDYIVSYTDTFTTGVPSLGWDVIDLRPHIPLHVEVHQRSSAWENSASDDFVIFNLTLKNIGDAVLEETYIGILIDGDATPIDNPFEFLDDIVGFRWVHLLDPLHVIGICTSRPDSVPVAWIADNDGDFNDQYPVRGVTGLTLLSPSPSEMNFSFNWYISNNASWLDYGPRHKANARDFGTGGKGTPEGDRNKYFMMRNGEIDFDSPLTATITENDPTWEYPDGFTAPPITAVFADPRYVMSVGPFTLEPGDSIPLVFAYVGGENLHQNAGSYERNLIFEYDPTAFLANLDFSHFENNVRAAAWLYDNPGVDTDGDGAAGNFVVCEGDTIRTTGDGVPDFNPVAGCCIGKAGNLDGDQSDQVNLADLSMLIAYLVVPRFSEAVECQKEANIDGAGIVDLTDLSRLIGYLTAPGSVDLNWCQ